jgi:Fe-S oxidoreductase
VYNEPRIGRAAVQVLEKLGYRVVLPRLGCCGRSFISLGMLADAAKVCRATATALLEVQAREQAVAIVGCEPSCVSAIKDEWQELELGLESEPLRELAEKTFLVEEFIERNWDSHPVDPTSVAHRQPAGGEPVLLHGHCHQKALWGVETSAAILKRLLGDRLTVLDSGCCGMAGSFGYSEERFDVSMKIGEQSLLGPLRENTAATVVAPGTSCRQQIYDGLRREAMHPVELIAQALGCG